MKKKPLRILYLEDDPADVEMIRETLVAEGFAPEILVVQTEADYLAQLNQGWDIILVDYNLPQFDGIKAIKLLKERELDLSIILISGTIGEDVAVTAMRAGASDYIMKDNLTRLGPAIKRGLHETVERRERKQSEETLARIAKEWHSTFNASNDGIWLLDEEHRIVRSNRQADRLFPSSAREGETRCWEVVHGITGPIADCPFVRAKESLQRETKELQIGDFWYMVTIDPILDADGKYTGAVHVLRDITNDKQSEAKHERLMQAIEQAAETIFITDEEGAIQYANPAFKQTSGYSCTEAIGKNPRILKSGQQDEAFYRDMWQTLTDGKTWKGRFVNKRKDGSFYTEEATISPVLDDADKTVNYVAVKRDITEQKQAEDALRESQKLIKDILNTIPVRVFWKDINLLYLGCNKAFALDAGFSNPQEIVGKNDIHMEWKDLAEMYNADDLRVIEGETILDREEPQTTPEGETIILLTSKVPLRNSQGQIIGILGAYIDITEQRKTEAQLQQALKMESIGRLAGGVAHDFNNMLQVILGYTNMALNEIDPETALHNDLTESRKAANRAADLTRQLLAFARKQTMTPKVLDLNETVSGMLMMLRRLIGENIDLTWQPTAADTTVKMDPAQIDQILANLCVNARDAIAGVGKLKVETSTLTADANFCAKNTDLVPGEYVTISVSDTGCGMDPETIKHIFEPFYTTKEVGEGTGLGLATVYGIVMQNKGCINLTSIPEKGTTFRLCLPRHFGEAVQLPTSDSAKAALRGHETILLVEDEASILKLGKQMLEGLGYRVLKAGLPNEAIAVAEKYTEEISLLLTDVVMPQMNGLDLATHLTLLHPEIKHMFMSGYTADIIIKQGLIEKGVHFIQKPFTIQDLAVKVREILD